jgi:signal transduction histidine kinase
MELMIEPLDSRQPHPDTATVVHDPFRLAALRATHLLDTEPEECFERLTRLVAALLNVPVALVSLVDGHRQFFKSAIGLPSFWADRRETPLSHSFCQHVVATSQPLIVENAREHPILKDNLAVPDLNVVAYLGVPLFDPEGMPLGALCAIDTHRRYWTVAELTNLSGIADITAREIHLRLSLQRNEALTTELRHSKQHLRELLSIATHDLNEPLRKIRTFGDMIRRHSGDNLSVSSRYSLDRMMNATDQMALMIDGLIRYAHISDRPLDICSMDLNTVIREVVEDMERSYGNLREWLVIDALPTIRADALQIRQLFYNLIDNALKFRQDGVSPLVRITFEQGGRTFRLSVSDNGIGFDGKYSERIFSLFERLEGRKRYAGNGIGLALCRRIVERHGGTLRASAAPGEGATFHIELPEMLQTSPHSTSTSGIHRAKELDARK